MSDRKLSILGIIAAFMVLWAVVQSYISAKPKTEPGSGTYLIQGLDPADIGSITIGTGVNAVVLKRKEGGFVVTNKQNYPADASKINKLLSACLDIKTSELYTSDKANHKDLGVTEENAKQIVKFCKPDSSLLSGVIIGKKRQQGKGIFVRLAGSDEVYVTFDHPEISDRAMNYIDEELMSINREDIVSVSVSSPNEVYTLKKGDDGSIALEDLPADKKLKDNVYERVFTALTNLSFDDVMKKGSAEASNLEFNRQYICKLKDSTVYSIKLAKKDGRTYVTCDADFTDKTPVVKESSVESKEQLKKKEAKLLAREKAEKFSAKHNDWVYIIPGYKARNMMKSLSELLEDKEKPKQASQASDPNTAKPKE